MPRTTTVKLDKDGYLQMKLPANVRKQLPENCTFELTANGSSLKLDPVCSSRKDDWSDFDEARARARRHFKGKRITMKDIVETRRRVREQQRAASNAR